MARAEDSTAARAAQTLLPGRLRCAFLLLHARLQEREDRGRRPRLRGTAGRAVVRQEVRNHRFRHQEAAHRRPQSRSRRDQRGRAGLTGRHALQVHLRPRRSGRRDLHHRRRADADRRQQPAGPHAAGQGVADRRTTPDQGRHRRLRVQRSTPASPKTSAGRSSRSCRASSAASTSPSATRPSGSTRATASTPSSGSPRSSPARIRPPSSGSPPSIRRWSPPACTRRPTSRSPRPPR